MIYKIGSESEVLNEFLDILEKFNSKTGREIGAIRKVASITIPARLRALAGVLEHLRPVHPRFTTAGWANLAGVSIKTPSIASLMQNIEAGQLVALDASALFLAAKDEEALRGAIGKVVGLVGKADDSADTKSLMARINRAIDASEELKLPLEKLRGMKVQLSAIKASLGASEFADAVVLAKYLESHIDLAATQVSTLERGLKDGATELHGAIGRDEVTPTSKWGAVSGTSTDEEFTVITNMDQVIAAMHKDIMEGVTGLVSLNEATIISTQSNLDIVRMDQLKQRWADKKSFLSEEFSMYRLQSEFFDSGKDFWMNQMIEDLRRVTYKDFLVHEEADELFAPYREYLKEIAQLDEISKHLDNIGVETLTPAAVPDAATPAAVPDATTPAVTPPTPNPRLEIDIPSIQPSSESLSGWTPPETIPVPQSLGMEIGASYLSDEIIDVQNSAKRYMDENDIAYSLEGGDYISALKSAEPARLSSGNEHLFNISGETIGEFIAKSRSAIGGKVIKSGDNTLKINFMDTSAEVLNQLRALTPNGHGLRGLHSLGVASIDMSQGSDFAVNAKAVYSTGYTLIAQPKGVSIIPGKKGLFKKSPTYAIEVDVEMDLVLISEASDEVRKSLGARTNDAVNNHLDELIYNPSKYPEFDLDDASGLSNSDPFGFNAQMKAEAKAANAIPNAWIETAAPTMAPVTVLENIKLPIGGMDISGVPRSGFVIDGQVIDGAGNIIDGELKSVRIPPSPLSYSVSSGVGIHRPSLGIGADGPNEAIMAWEASYAELMKNELAKVAKSQESRTAYAEATLELHAWDGSSRPDGTESALIAEVWHGKFSTAEELTIYTSNGRLGLLTVEAYNGETIVGGMEILAAGGYEFKYYDGWNTTYLDNLKESFPFDVSAIEKKMAQYLLSINIPDDHLVPNPNMLVKFHNPGPNSSYGDVMKAYGGETEGLSAHLGFDIYTAKPDGSTAIVSSYGGTIGTPRPSAAIMSEFFRLYDDIFIVNGTLRQLYVSSLKAMKTSRSIEFAPGHPNHLPKEYDNVNLAPWSVQAAQVGIDTMPPTSDTNDITGLVPKAYTRADASRAVSTYIGDNPRPTYLPKSIDEAAEQVSDSISIYREAYKELLDPVDGGVPKSIDEYIARQKAAGDNEAEIRFVRDEVESNISLANSYVEMKAHIEHIAEAGLLPAGSNLGDGNIIFFSSPSSGGWWTYSFRTRTVQIKKTGAYVDMKIRKTVIAESEVSRGVELGAQAAMGEVRIPSGVKSAPERFLADIINTRYWPSPGIIEHTEGGGKLVYSFTQKVDAEAMAGAVKSAGGTGVMDSLNRMIQVGRQDASSVGFYSGTLTTASPGDLARPGGAAPGLSPWAMIGPLDESAEAAHKTDFSHLTGPGVIIPDSAYAHFYTPVKETLGKLNSVLGESVVSEAKHGFRPEKLSTLTYSKSRFDGVPMLRDMVRADSIAMSERAVIEYNPRTNALKLHPDGIGGSTIEIGSPNALEAIEGEALNVLDADRRAASMKITLRKDGFVDRHTQIHGVNDQPWFSARLDSPGALYNDYQTTFSEIMKRKYDEILSEYWRTLNPTLDDLVVKYDLYAAKKPRTEKTIKLREANMAKVKSSIIEALNPKAIEGFVDKEFTAWLEEVRVDGFAGGKVGGVEFARIPTENLIFPSITEQWPYVGIDAAYSTRRLAALAPAGTGITIETVNTRNKLSIKFALDYIKANKGREELADLSKIDVKPKGGYLSESGAWVIEDESAFGDWASNLDQEILKITRRASRSDIDARHKSIIGSRGGQLPQRDLPSANNWEEMITPVREGYAVTDEAALLASSKVSLLEALGRHPDGLHNGDIILEVDGISTGLMSNKDIADLKSTKSEGLNSKVKLSVRRANPKFKTNSEHSDETEPFHIHTIEVNRNLINFEAWNRQSGSTQHIVIDNFSSLSKELISGELQGSPVRLNMGSQHIGVDVLKDSITGIAGIGKAIVRNVDVKIHAHETGADILTPDELAKLKKIKADHISFGADLTGPGLAFLNINADMSASLVDSRSLDELILQSFPASSLSIQHKGGDAATHNWRRFMAMLIETESAAQAALANHKGMSSAVLETLNSHYRWKSSIYSDMVGLNWEPYLRLQTGSMDPGSKSIKILRALGANPTDEALVEAGQTRVAYNNFIQQRVGLEVERYRISKFLNTSVGNHTPASPTNDSLWQIEEFRESFREHDDVGREMASASTDSMGWFLAESINSEAINPVNALQSSMMGKYVRFLDALDNIAKYTDSGELMKKDHTGISAPYIVSYNEFGLEQWNKSIYTYGVKAEDLTPGQKVLVDLNGDDELARILAGRLSILPGKVPQLKPVALLSWDVIMAQLGLRRGGESEQVVDLLTEFYKRTYLKALRAASVQVYAGRKVSLDSVEALAGLHPKLSAAWDATMGAGRGLVWVGRGGLGLLSDVKSPFRQSNVIRRMEEYQGRDLARLEAELAKDGFRNNKLITLAGALAGYVELGPLGGVAGAHLGSQPRWVWSWSPIGEFMGGGKAIRGRSPSAAKFFAYTGQVRSVGAAATAIAGASIVLCALWHGVKRFYGDDESPDDYTDIGGIFEKLKGAAGDLGSDDSSGSGSFADDGLLSRGNRVDYIYKLISTADDVPRPEGMGESWGPRAGWEDDNLTGCLDPRSYGSNFYIFGAAVSNGISHVKFNEGITDCVEDWLNDHEIKDIMIYGHGKLGGDRSGPPPAGERERKDENWFSRGSDGIPQDLVDEIVDEIKSSINTHEKAINSAIHQYYSGASVDIEIDGADEKLSQLVERVLEKIWPTAELTAGQGDQGDFAFPIESSIETGSLKGMAVKPEANLGAIWNREVYGDHGNEPGENSFEHNPQGAKEAWTYYREYMREQIIMMLLCASSNWAEQITFKFGNIPVGEKYRKSGSITPEVLEQAQEILIEIRNSVPSSDELPEEGEVPTTPW
jgi:hypothetical protein